MRMSERCSRTCPVIEECNTRVQAVANKQRRLLNTHRALTENSFVSIEVAHSNGTLQPVTFPAHNPARERVESQLKRHESIIGAVASGAAQVEAAQDACESGPDLALHGKLLLSLATIAHGLGAMQAESYLAERDELTNLYPRCSSPDAYAALAQVPILGHRQFGG